MKKAMSYRIKWNENCKYHKKISLITEININILIKNRKKFKSLDRD